MVPLGKKLLFVKGKMNTTSTMYLVFSKELCVVDQSQPWYKNILYIVGLYEIHTEG